MADTPAIGHNNPPTPAAEHAAIIRELHSEGQAWLSGADIPNAEAAKDVGAFLGRADAALKAAKDAKEAEYRPLKTKLDAVTEAFKAPLAQAESVIKSGKELLTKWQRKQDAERARIAAAARAEAERQAEEARQALMASYGDIAAREEAERLAEAAKTQAIAAAVIAKPERAKIGGRSLRMVETVEIEVSNPNELLRWAYRLHEPELVGLATELARKAAKAGASHIDGVNIIRERTAA
jgi:hypothetical protein